MIYVLKSCWFLFHFYIFLFIENLLLTHKFFSMTLHHIFFLLAHSLSLSLSFSIIASSSNSLMTNFHHNFLPFTLKWLDHDIMERYDMTFMMVMTNKTDCNRIKNDLKRSTLHGNWVKRSVIFGLLLMSLWVLHQY